MKRCALIVGAGLIVGHNAIFLALDVLLLKKARAANPHTFEPARAIESLVICLEEYGREYGHNADTAS